MLFLINISEKVPLVNVMLAMAHGSRSERTDLWFYRSWLKNLRSIWKFDWNLLTIAVNRARISLTHPVLLRGRVAITNWQFIDLSIDREAIGTCCSRNRTNIATRIGNWRAWARHQPVARYRTRFHLKELREISSPRLRRETRIRNWEIDQSYRFWMPASNSRFPYRKRFRRIFKVASLKDFGYLWLIARAGCC